MKRQYFYFTILTVFSVLKLSAQEKTFKPFSVTLGFSLNTPLNSEILESNSKGIFIEPKYNLNDKLYLGAHLEYSFFYLLDGGFVFNEADISISALNFYNGADIKSALFLTEYYFNKEKLRPFVGLGLGAFSTRKFLLDVFDFEGQDFNFFIEKEMVTNLGVVPRAGLNYGHLKFGIAYHFTGKDIADYISINAGLDIGGGKYKKEKKNNKKKSFWKKKDESVK